MQKLEMQPQRAGTKNTRGNLGAICNNCGGFGFTLNIVGGQSMGCNHCAQTGIAQMTGSQLESRVANLEDEIRGLKQIILNEIERSKK